MQTPSDCSTQKRRGRHEFFLISVKIQDCSLLLSYLHWLMIICDIRKVHAIPIKTYDRIRSKSEICISPSTKERYALQKKKKNYAQQQGTI